MKLAISLLAAVFAAVAAGEDYVCNTSDASPYLHNVNEMIGNLNDAEIGVLICNPGPVNGCGQTWTGYSGSGGAAFMICGGSMRCSGSPGGIPCSVGACGGMRVRGLASYLEAIRDKCQGPDSNGDIRVGGIVRLVDADGSGGDGEIKLFSKPG